MSSRMLESEYIYLDYFAEECLSHYTLRNEFLMLMLHHMVIT